jgi:hypothetical protein
MCCISAIDLLRVFIVTLRWRWVATGRGLANRSIEHLLSQGLWPLR